MRRTSAMAQVAPLGSEDPLKRALGVRCRRPKHQAGESFVSDFEVCSRGQPAAPGQSAVVSRSFRTFSFG